VRGLEPRWEPGELMVVRGLGGIGQGRLLLNRGCIRIEVSAGPRVPGLCAGNRGMLCYDAMQ